VIPEESSEQPGLSQDAESASRRDSHGSRRRANSHRSQPNPPHPNRGVAKVRKAVRDDATEQTNDTGSHTPFTSGAETQPGSPPMSVRYDEKYVTTASGLRRFAFERVVTIHEDSGQEDEHDVVSSL
jgi:hypothetical protein